MRFFSRLFSSKQSPDLRHPPEERQARELLRAIDTGGIPLNPARVNHIARSLGLEVKTTAPIEETIQRIRAAIARFPIRG